MFCNSKRDMIRLCKLLNKAAADPSERGLEFAELDIYEVARLKRDVKALFPGRDNGPVFPKGSYFIWWGGERAPQTQDEFLLTRFSGLSPYWKTVFAEYITPDARELLVGIKESRPEGFQENDWIRTFHPDEDNQISLDLIDQL